MRKIIARFSNELYDSDRRPHPLVEEMLAIFQYRELIYQFVSRSIKTRYKRSILGVVWTMLNPLLTMIVLTIVFSNLFRFEIVHFPIYVLSGQVVWIFFSNEEFALRALLAEFLLTRPPARNLAWWICPARSRLMRSSYKFAPPESCLHEFVLSGLACCAPWPYAFV